MRLSLTAAARPNLLAAFHVLLRKTTTQASVTQFDENEMIALCTFSGYEHVCGDHDHRCCRGPGLQVQLIGKFSAYQKRVTYT